MTTMLMRVLLMRTARLMSEAEGGDRAVDETAALEGLCGGDERRECLWSLARGHGSASRCAREDWRRCQGCC